jgi:1-deoxy-D-xylulose-5-phosphate synthase
MVLMAASDENELARMVVTAHGINDRPSAFRYPRGEGFGVKMDADPKPLSIGKGRIISKGEKIAFLSYGTRLNEVKKAAAMFAKSHEITPTIADARFAKPLDHALIDELVGSHDILITIEEGSCGGFGSFVLDYLATSGQLSSCKISTLHLPDSYTDHASQESQYANVKLDAQGIYDHAFSMFSR